MHFVHLRTHTEFSVVDGTLRVDDAVQAAAKDGQVAMAITDLSNLFGGVKFYNAARKKGVQPLLGADVWLEPDAETRPASRLLLLVQDRTGYLNLCEILSRAWITNVQRNNQAWVRWDWLAELGQGLIALSGGLMGAVGQALAVGDAARARELAERQAALFPDRFYLELQRAQLPGQDAHVRATVPLAAQLGLPVVATHPIQFLEPDDFDAHEARVCVADGDTLANPKRVRRFSRDQHFKTQAEMAALFADIPSAIANTVEIARRCSLTLVLGKPQLPDFPTPMLADGTPMPMADYFRQLSFEGLEDRLKLLYPDVAQRDAQRPRYVDRLEFELTTILKMGFPGYFLIVSDFIRWAKANGCPVGPGRGSGAGSLVAYALSITDLDPLQYNLLFERFLNPERVSMPDFDIDFCQGNRDRVIDYVKQKYGRDAVSQIATFGTMAAKAALRDVGRVLGMSYGHVDSVAKLVPAPPGKVVTLARVPDKPDGGVIYARKENPEIEQRERDEVEVAELLSLAMRVEGMVRNVGMHAGGVLIAPGKITDFCPLYMQPGSDSAVSMFDKDDVESIGLVKFDFLGLATLTILELTKKFIRERHADRRDFDFESLPLDDRATYRLMAEGRTVAVFQLESAGMQRMLREAKPSVFEDVIALVALYRPGPMDLIPSFCARKHGREEVSYPHPLMEEVLSETYGIMIYQEQVMQVAQRLGGYSLGGADLLRRAMGKKKLEEMVAHRSTFAQGAAAQGIGEAKANEIFDLMEKFAGYGFNKSHAAAYSLLAYQTAYLKCHHPAAFMAATLSSEMADTDKVQFFVADAVSGGLTFLPPDVNRSRYRFTPVDAKTIRYGLGAIKGTGESAIGAIARAREEGGDFADLFDFCRRIDKRVANRRVIEALIRAGAFDSIDERRSSLMASVGIALEAAEQAERDALQVGLFDTGGAGEQRLQPVAAPPWSERERLLNEKQALGFFLSGHPYNEIRAELSAFIRRPLASLEPQKEPLLLAGIVTATRTQMTRRGKMIVVTLDDGTAQVEMTVFNELYEAERAKIREDEPLIVEGKVSRDDFSGGLRINADRLLTLAEARGRFAKALRLALNGKVGLGDTATEKLRLLLAPYRNGPCPVRVRYRNTQAECELPLGESWRVRLDDELLAGLQQWLEAENVEVVYQ